MRSHHHTPFHRFTKTPLRVNTRHAMIIAILQLFGVATANPLTLQPPKPARTTKLELFLRSRGIKPAHVAHESGYSRQHLLRIRTGRIDPDTRCMRAIVKAVRRLSGESIRASDLFGAAAIRAGMPG